MILPCKGCLPTCSLSPCVNTDNIPFYHGTEDTRALAGSPLSEDAAGQAWTTGKPPPPARQPRLYRPTIY